MTLDATLAALPKIRESLDFPVRVEWTDRKSIPSAWAHADNQTKANNVQHRALLTVDIWTQSRGHMDECIEALSWLDGHIAAEQGTARVLEYWRESVNVIDEAVGVVHGTIICSCTFVREVEWT